MPEDPLNLSVTDEDLQKLDDANSRNAFFRKVYPPKCHLLLDRALKVQLESLTKIKTNVHAVEPIENVETVDESHSLLQVNQECAKLRTNIKESLDKLQRLEKAQKILLNHQNGSC